jgi:hypothetical protein
MVYEDDMELVLPSGKRLGHRALRRYYRQNLRPTEVILFFFNIRVFYKYLLRNLLLIYRNEIRL